MPEPYIVWPVLVLLMLIVSSALLSGSEVAFFSLSAREIDELRGEEDNSGSRILKLLNRPRFLLAIILIANNLVNVGIVIMSYYITEQLLAPGVSELVNFLVTGVGATLLLVLFGEVLPKVYASKYNLKVAQLMSRPLSILQSKLLFGIPAQWLVKSGLFIEKRIQRKGGNDGLLSQEELELAIDLTTGPRSTKQEVDMLKGIVKFSSITVKQIMRSRLDIVAVDASISFKELLDVVNESGFSRIPVYEETPDSIKGLLYAKDLLEHLNEAEDYVWKDLIKPVEFVPETKKIDDLLKEIQENRRHLVIVVDEYGGTSGLITLEDILEEVIGEIRDEYDQVDVEHLKIDDKNYVFAGKTLLNDVCKVIDIREDEFEDVRGDADSLGGLILELSGKIPNVKERVRYNDFLFTVEELGKNRIERVKVTLEDRDEK